MELTDKLAAVEVRSDNRISAADRAYCEAQQKAYEDARCSLSEISFLVEEMGKRQDEILGAYDKEERRYTGYTDISGFGSNKIGEKIFRNQSFFISKITGYFNRSYHVSINADRVNEALLPFKPERDYDGNKTVEWEKTVRGITLHYTDVLDQIFIQLGGRTFLERAIDEIKKNCHEAVWSGYDGECYYELKNQTLRLRDYFCDYEYWFRRECWKSNDRMRKVAMALAYFETETIGSIPNGLQAFCGWDEMNFPEIELTGCTKLSQIRMFKNGRVDVKFQSKQNAAAFVSDYLGTVC